MPGCVFWKLKYVDLSADAAILSGEKTAQSDD
jgi:hypothetical protein